MCRSEAFQHASLPSLVRVECMTSPVIRFQLRLSDVKLDVAEPQLGGSELLSELCIRLRSWSGSWLHDAGSDPARPCTPRLTRPSNTHRLASDVKRQGKPLNMLWLRFSAVRAGI